MRHIAPPIPTAVLRGGFCAMSGAGAPAQLEAALRDRFSGELAEGNAAAAREAHAWVAAEMKELAHAASD